MKQEISIVRDNIESEIEAFIQSRIELLSGKNNVIRRWYNKTELTDRQIAKSITRHYAEGIIIKQKWDDRKVETTSKLVYVALAVGKELTDEGSSTRLKAQVGMFGADIVVRLGMIDIENRKLDGKTIGYLSKVDHKEFNKLSRKVMLAYPNEYKYGYWKEPYNKGLPIVKKIRKEDSIHYTQEQIPMVYRVLNALGSTKWHVNQFVFDVASGGLDGFTPDYIDAQDASKARRSLPEKMRIADGMVDWIIEQRIKDQPELKNNPKLLGWIKRQAHVTAAGRYKEMSFDAVTVISEYAKYFRFIEMMEYITEMVDQEFGFVYNMDSRGRFYTVQHGISPQGSDIEKAMLQFKTGTLWNDVVKRNMTIHTANCAGMDKLTFDDRVKWTEDNMENIEYSYMALLGGETTTWLDQFKGEKKTKWQLIAAIGVWGQIATSESPEEEWIKVPIGLDATCSGLQILSVIGRDETCAEHVNIKKCEYAPVGDLYQHVGGNIYDALQNEDKKCATLKSHPVLQDRSAKLWRKLPKRLTMTYPYACQARSMGNSAFEDRKDHGDDIIAELKYKECLEFGEIGFQQIERALPRAASVMGFLQDCASTVKEGTLSWTNGLTGFRAYQRYEKSKGTQVKCEINSVRRDITIHEWYNMAKKADHKRAISANFTHSQDSALLTITVDRLIEDGYKEFHVIHDQIGVHAGGVDDVSIHVRGAFLDLYEDGDTLELFAEEIGVNVQVPEKGTYNIYEIMFAEYLFC